MTDNSGQFDFVKYVINVLEQLHVNYFVTGSMASMYYGEIRATNDIDIVAALRPEHVLPLLKRFPPPDFYVSEEAVRDAIQNHFQFNVIHWPSGLKADLMQLGNNAFDQSRFGRIRRSSPTDLLNAWVAAPEDVIIKKLLYFREGGGEKHLRDIASMLRISGETFDLEYVSSWVKQFQLEEIWTAILQREKEAP